VGVIKRLTRCDGTTDTEGTPMEMPIMDLSGQDQPKPSDRHLRGIATVLGKFLPDLPKAIEEASETHAVAMREIGTEIEVSIDQVGTEISDLTAAVRELTELVKGMAVFPRQPWGKTRLVISWFLPR
jgi:hypothetical protein